jgi:hypothetical protein
MIWFAAAWLSSPYPAATRPRLRLRLNLQTAQALGIEVPSGLLSIADEVIE